MASAVRNLLSTFSTSFLGNGDDDGNKSDASLASPSSRDIEKESDNDDSSSASASPSPDDNKRSVDSDHRSSVKEKSGSEPNDAVASPLASRSRSRSRSHGTPSDSDSIASSDVGPFTPKPSRGKRRRRLVIDSDGESENDSDIDSGNDSHESEHSNIARGEALRRRSVSPTPKVSYSSSEESDGVEPSPVKCVAGGDDVWRSVSPLPMSSSYMQASPSPSPFSREKSPEEMRAAGFDIEDENDRMSANSRGVSSMNVRSKSPAANIKSRVHIGGDENDHHALNRGSSVESEADLSDVHLNVSLRERCAQKLTNSLSSGGSKLNPAAARRGQQNKPGGSRHPLLRESCVRNWGVISPAVNSPRSRTRSSSLPASPSDRLALGVSDSIPSPDHPMDLSPRSSVDNSRSFHERPVSVSSSREVFEDRDSFATPASKKPGRKDFAIAPGNSSASARQTPVRAEVAALSERIRDARTPGSSEKSSHESSSRKGRVYPRLARSPPFSESSKHREATGVSNRKGNRSAATSRKRRSLSVDETSPLLSRRGDEVHRRQGRRDESPTKRRLVSALSEDEHKHDDSPPPASSSSRPSAASSSIRRILARESEGAAEDDADVGDRLKEYRERYLASEKARRLAESRISDLEMRVRHSDARLKQQRSEHLDADRRTKELERQMNEMARQHALEKQHWKRQVENESKRCGDLISKLQDAKKTVVDTQLEFDSQVDVRRDLELVAKSRLAKIERLEKGLEHVVKHELYTGSRSFYAELLSRRWLSEIRDPSNVAVEDLVSTVVECSPTEFELWTRSLYEVLGFHAEHVGKANDGGIDVLLRRPRESAGDGSGAEEQIFVQCKQLRKKKVSPGQLRDLKGVMATQGVQRGVFVTISSYTQEGVDFARRSHIELVDNTRLVALLRKHARAIIAAQRRFYTERMESMRSMVQRFVQSSLQAWHESTKGTLNDISSLCTQLVNDARVPLYLRVPAQMELELRGFFPGVTLLDADAIRPYSSGNDTSTRAKPSNSSSSSSSKHPPLSRLTPAAASRGTSRAPAPSPASRAPAPMPPLSRVDPMDSVLQRLERMPSGGSDMAEDDELVAPPGIDLRHPQYPKRDAASNSQASTPSSQYSSGSSSSQASGSSSGGSSHRGMPVAIDTENVDDDWGSPQGFGAHTPVGGDVPERSPSPDDSQTFLNDAKSLLTRINRDFDLFCEVMYKTLLEKKLQVVAHDVPDNRCMVALTVEPVVLVHCLFLRPNERVTADDVSNLARAFRSEHPDRAVPVRALLITNRSFERGAQSVVKGRSFEFMSREDLQTFFVMKAGRRVVEHFFPRVAGVRGRRGKGSRSRTPQGASVGNAPRSTSRTPLSNRKQPLQAHPSPFNDSAGTPSERGRARSDQQQVLNKAFSRADMNSAREQASASRNLSGDAVPTPRSLAKRGPNMRRKPRLRRKLGKGKSQQSVSSGISAGKQQRNLASASTANSSVARVTSVAPQSQPLPPLSSPVHRFSAESPLAARASSDISHLSPGGGFADSHARSQSDANILSSASLPYSMTGMRNVNTTRTRKKFTTREDSAILRGFEKYTDEWNKWDLIIKDPEFRDTFDKKRTASSLKDRYNNILKKRSQRSSSR